MKTQRYEMVLRRRESGRLTLNDLAAHADLRPQVVSQFVEFGLITPAEHLEEVLLFDPASVPRLLTILRLRRSLSINLPGISVVLDLLDKVTALQRENDALRRGG